MKWTVKSSNVYRLPTSWNQLIQGEHYCNALSQYFSPWFNQVLGYQWLKIGGLSGEIVCHLPLRHQIVLSPIISEKLTALKSTEDLSLVQANPLALPLIEKSIDACILANTLNFCQDPHQLLRETHRVLNNEGYLFLSLFNPFNPLFFKSSLHSKNQQKQPFRCYSTWRVMDWLELLNFEILHWKYLSAEGHQHWFAPLIAVVAQKRTYPLTLNTKMEKSKETTLFQTAEAFKTQPN